MHVLFYVCVGIDMENLTVKETVYIIFLKYALALEFDHPVVDRMLTSCFGFEFQRVLHTVILGSSDALVVYVNLHTQKKK